MSELDDELLRISPEGGPVSPVSLAIATANLNTRILTRGLSAREIWYQRDQFTNCQLPIPDLHLISQQHAHRIQNHPASEIFKCSSNRRPLTPSIQVGDLVYITSDGSKTRARDHYLVIPIDGLWCNVGKFTGTQLHSTSYRVKLAEYFHLHDQPSFPSKTTSTPVTQLPLLPRVPEALSLPPSPDPSASPLSHVPYYPHPSSESKETDSGRTAFTAHDPLTNQPCPPPLTRLCICSCATPVHATSIQSSMSPTCSFAGIYCLLLWRIYYCFNTIKAIYVLKESVWQPETELH